MKNSKKSRAKKATKKVTKEHFQVFFHQVNYTSINVKAVNEQEAIRIASNKWKRTWAEANVSAVEKVPKAEIHSLSFERSHT